MPITSGWRDTVDNIIFPTDYCRWDDLGNGSGSYFTVTAVGGVTLSAGDGLNGSGTTEFTPENAGYWRINYTDALRLSNRSAWTIDFYIRIDSDSTSTTNFQTAHEGVVFAAGEGGLLTDDGSTRTVDYAGTIDANRKFKFYYNDGSTLNSITSVATIGVDDFHDIKIVYEDSEIKIYINNVLDSTTSASAGITNTSNNFVIGGNSTGDYLLSAKVDAFRIRKDAFYTQNVHTVGLGLSTDRQLIDADPSTDGYDNTAWDINTLICFFFNEGEGSTAPKPRQLKLIPQTWGDWDYWWVNPKSQIEVATGTLTFGSPITGFKDVNIVTTDGFLCSYIQGQDLLNGSSVAQAWKSTNNSSNRHALITDLNPITELKDDGPFGSGLISTTSTNYSLTLPSAGYLPDEQVTESQSLLDTTKVDSLSSNSQYNQGMRPRGIKQITYLINEQVAVEELNTANDQDRRFFMGLPYYEVRDASSNLYEGGIYSFKKSNQSSSRFDSDFRLGNSNTRMIESIDDNSSSGAGLIITTRTAHGLSDGDKIMVRPGLFRNPHNHPNTGTGSTGVMSAFDAHRLHGISHVKVRSTTEVELFSDSGLTNPVNTSTFSTLSLQVPGYIITPNSSGVPYIKDLDHKLLEYTNPVADIKDIKSNREVIHRPTIERTGQLSFTTSPGDFGMPTTRQAEQTVKEFFSTLPTDSVEFKTTPRGNNSDPIEITTYSTGVTSSALDAAPIFLDLDLPTNGTLHVQVSDIERADSSTETPQQLTAHVGFNGHSPSEGTDDALLNYNLDSADSITFPISADSEMADDELRSIQLFAAIDGVTHTSASDVTRATWKIWFVSDVSEDNNRIFWAGGIPPGYNRLSNGPRATQALDSNCVARARQALIYKSDGDASQFQITGIPLIAHSLLGETYISSGDTFEIFRAEGSGDSQHYDLNRVSETISKTAGGVSDQGPDIAPWVRFASQTKGQYRLHERRRYECLETHTSSKEFVTDLQLGRWQLV